VTIRNIFAGIPADLPNELMQSLHEGKGVRIERIVSSGHASPEDFWYDQDEHEWVLLLQGAAGLAFEGEDKVHELWSGDCMLIPAHTRHRVAWTDADAVTIWLAIFHG